MSKSKSPLNSSLRKRWSNLLERLHATNPEVGELAEELLAESFESSKSGSLPDFSHVDSALDAILMYLRATEEWTSTRVMTEAILNGGYAQGDWTRRANLRDAIDYATNISRKLVRREDKKIGLPDWVDDEPSQPQI